MKPTAQELKTEFDNDSAGLGYKVSGVLQGNAALLGLLAAPSTAFQIDRGLIPAFEIVNATDASDWAGLATL